MRGALTVLDLIQNGTMSAEMAATMWGAMDDRSSFIVAAGPRQAGKSTNTNAILGMLPDDVALHDLSGETSQFTSLAASPDGGYIVVAEFSNHMPIYLRGEQVMQVFQTAEKGYSIAGTLHADTPEDLFYELRSHGPLRDDDLARIRYLVFLAMRGTMEKPLLRRVASVWEVTNVTGGTPAAQMLHQWNGADDSFKVVGAPTLLTATGTELADRAARLRTLAVAGQTSAEDLASLLAG
jgi:hypothetical protein